MPSDVNDVLPTAAGDLYEEAILHVAAALDCADAVLVISGAGMAVDSGLGTFRGKSAMHIPLFAATGLDYRDLSVPKWFKDEPGLAWGFWSQKTITLLSAEPHEGYRILWNWGSQMKYGSFAVTSNIDGAWIRVFGPDHVYEHHGAVTHLQSMDPEDPDIWEVQLDVIKGAAPPQWPIIQAATKCEVMVGKKHIDREWKHAVLHPDGRVTDVEGIGDMASGGNIVPDIRAVRLCAGKPDLVQCPDESLPRSRRGALARPNVMMFDDTKGGHRVKMERIAQQQSRYEAWLQALPEDSKLVVIEIGAGDTVGTIRRLGEELVAKRLSSMLVRINRDQAAFDTETSHAVQGQGRAISIGLGALETLQRIQSHRTWKT